MKPGICREPPTRIGNELLVVSFRVIMPPKGLAFIRQGPPLFHTHESMRLSASAPAQQNAVVLLLLKVWGLDMAGHNIWVNYNDHTAISLEMMVHMGNHPQMPLMQVSELS